MFAERHLKFSFLKLKLPDEINDVHASLFLSLAGAAINCGSRGLPTEKFCNFLEDQDNVTRLLCRRWCVLSLNHIAFSFVDASRVTADDILIQNFLRPESMAEVSGCQGNWCWFVDQLFM